MNIFIISSQQLCQVDNMKFVMSINCGFKPNLYLYQCRHYKSSRKKPIPKLFFIKKSQNIFENITVRWWRRVKDKVKSNM